MIPSPASSMTLWTLHFSCHQYHRHLEDSYTLPSLPDSLRCSLAHLWTTVSVRWPEDFPADFSVIKQDWLFCPSWPASMVPSKQRFPFSGAGLVLISEDPSTPTDKKLQIFNSNISQFLASLHNPGFHCRRFSQHTLISQALPEQPIKLWVFSDFWNPNFQALPQSSTIQHSHVCHTCIPTLGTISISVCFLLLWLFSIAMINHWPKQTSRGRGLFSSPSSFLSIDKKSQNRN